MLREIIVERGYEIWSRWLWRQKLWEQSDLSSRSRLQLLQLHLKIRCIDHNKAILQLMLLRHSFLSACTICSFSNFDGSTITLWYPNSGATNHVANDLNNLNISVEYKYTMEVNNILVMLNQRTQDNLISCLILHVLLNLFSLNMCSMCLLLPKILTKTIMCFLNSTLLYALSKSGHQGGCSQGPYS